MGRVTTHMTMSLDGFVAHDDDTIEGLFDWYGAGDVALASDNPDIGFHVDQAGADLLRGIIDSTGALVSGRRLFDITDGWGDRHPIGAPVVVVTHRPPDDAARWPRTTFVDGVGPAIQEARRIAGDRDVVVSSADVARQALDLGLLDEVAVSLVPIVLGHGVPWFAGVTGGPHLLEDPEVVVGTRVTHLRYRVRRPSLPSVGGQE